MKNFLLHVLALSKVVRAVETMAGTVSVVDKIVGEQTSLTYQLFLNIERVVDEDYVLISLPEEQDVAFTTGRAFCTVSLPLVVTKCERISALQAKITY